MSITINKNGLRSYNLLDIKIFTNKINKEIIMHNINKGYITRSKLDFWYPYLW